MKTNVERMDRVLNRLACCWAVFPQMRFGQLIENLKSFAGYTDIFYLEDDALEKIIEGYINKEGFKE